MGLFNKLNERVELMGEMFAQTDALQDSRNYGWSLEGKLKNAMYACAGCQDTDKCRKWLAEGRRHADPPGFCPNAARIRQFRSDF
ncbi:DUF6455 family protein [Pelagibius sp. Alg239-R121]|uniref:DUF6455 family protein n=1 Tax=Pelagibius sp. Alg239-R121 TaxID=2993448 RepID=UPI0024A722B7|nr:DUF6455 family protein [Pelagibius sp. Alg239-R121]